MQDTAIADLALRLKLHHADTGTRSWGTGVPVRRLDTSTGSSSVVLPSEVPEHATGMMVRSGLYDVNRFVWGSRNLWAVVVHMNGNDIYYNETDDDLLRKVLDTSFEGTPVFGSGVIHHKLD